MVKWIDVWRVLYIDTGGGHPIWDQEDYNKRKMQRAFLLATKLNDINISYAEWQTARTEVERVVRGSRHGPHMGFWTMHRGDKSFIVEALLTCGRYYDLRDVTRALEGAMLDNAGWSKETHMTYEHEEWTIGRFKQHVDEAVATVINHPLVTQGRTGQLEWGKIKNWIFCAGRESKQFPEVVQAAIDNATNEDFSAALRRNLNDELGKGDPNEAHFQHYLQLLRTLNISRSEFDGYPEGDGLKRALEIAAEVINARDEALMLGYLLVNEELTGPIYGAIEQSLTRRRPEVHTKFFQIHVEGERDHVRALLVAGDQLQANRSERVLEGIRQGAEDMRSLLNEAYYGASYRNPVTRDSGG
jgi:pyrroloquinoline quinone (PQQ) biosynthesis protein C